MSPISVLYHRNIEKKIYNVSWKNLFQTNTRQSVSVLVQVVVSRRATSGAEVGGGGGGWGGLPCPFFENRKKCPDFGKMSPVCVHLWIKILI